MNPHICGNTGCLVMRFRGFAGLCGDGWSGKGGQCLSIHIQNGTRFRFEMFRDSHVVSGRPFGPIKLRLKPGSEPPVSEPFLDVGKPFADLDKVVRGPRRGPMERPIMELMSTIVLITKIDAFTLDFVDRSALHARACEAPRPEETCPASVRMEPSICRPFRQVDHASKRGRERGASVGASSVYNISLSGCVRMLAKRFHDPSI